VTRRLIPALLAVVVALPATAVAADLDEMLDTGEGSFSGVGIVMCTWGRDAAAASYEISRRDGMSMVEGPEGDLMLSGSLSAVWSDGASSALELGGWSQWEMSDRYEAVETSVERLGRPATEALVYEGDLLRARIVVDDVSTVPLLTEVFTDDGTLYRMSALVEFESEAPDLTMPDDMPEHEMLMPTEPSEHLPVSANGYRRVDTYEMGETTQAYYSDGLFSFSVFESRRAQAPEQFDGTTAFVVGDDVYRRIVTPTVVWVHWNAPDRSYVLVGDLPPDHLTAVLEELPEPGRRNLFVRLWRRLFC
jgi:hypothetical protein